MAVPVSLAYNRDLLPLDLERPMPCQTNSKILVMRGNVHLLAAGDCDQGVKQGY